MMDKVHIKENVSVRHLVVSAHQFTNVCSNFQIVSSWWPPISWIILRVVNPLSESFNPFNHMYKMWLHFCKQFQRFLVCMLMFSQVLSDALCLVFVLWQPKKQNLYSGLVQMNWVSYNYFSLIHGSHNMNQQKLFTIGVCTKIILAW